MQSRLDDSLWERATFLATVNTLLIVTIIVRYYLLVQEIAIYKA